MAYTTPDDVRTGGGLTDPPWTNAVLQPYIDQASSFIDWATGWFFESRDLVINIDGNDTPILLVPLPIIDVTKIELIDWPGVPSGIGEVGLDSVAIYNRHLTENLTNPDDRKNPKIAFLGVVEGLRVIATDVWPGGHQNIRLTGKFGYTDYAGGSPAEGITPVMIADVCVRLVLLNLPPAPGVGSILPTDPVQYEHMMRARGRVKREKVRDQEIEYTTFGSGSGGAGNELGIITGDSRIDMVLLSYSRPSNMRTA